MREGLKPLSEPDHPVVGSHTLLNALSYVLSVRRSREPCGRGALHVVHSGSNEKGLAAWQRDGFTVLMS